MCGIAGVIGLPHGEAAVQRMLAALRHRGPDDEGVLQVAPGVWLGSRRLAILDLSPAGHMPMVEPASGCAIAYNGELYNFAELRAALEARGIVFSSRTDTEVVLAAYVAWGTEVLRRLRGMFVFASADPRRREVLLVRDPIGEKPLYYVQGARWVAFASEVRALLASGLVAKRLDRRGLEVYLANGFLVDPVTLVEGVRALLPGTWMRVSFDGTVLDTGRFWWGPLRERVRSTVDVEALRSCFEEAVRLRLVADVPLGAFLSGGLDSTSVVALMARVGRSPKTVTVRLPGSVLDESAFAKDVATELGTEHREVVAAGPDLVSWAADGLAALDQPSFDGINTYIVARAARQAGLTVALSGLGGDELFGGYPFLRYAAWMVRLLTVLGPATRAAAPLGRLAVDHGPAKLLAALGMARHLPVFLASYQATQLLFAEATRRRLTEAEDRPQGVVGGLPAEFVTFLEEERDETSVPDQLSWLTLRLFCGQRTLRDSDAVSMAVSLELRPPLLDRVLVELAFGVPGAKRLVGIPNKLFEREVVEPFLPRAFARRPKAGFVLPFEEWLAPDGVLAELARERLGDPALLRRAGLRHEMVRRFSETTQLPWSRRWALLALVDWVARTGVEA